MQPFRELIKPNQKFYWDDTLDTLFESSKSVLIDLVKDGVQSYDISRTTCIQPDWSKDGVGYLLLQKHCRCAIVSPVCCENGWKLIHAGSRFTNPAESNYAPTEGEALAVAWSLEHSRLFTLGFPNLVVATDHKPLLGILNDRALDRICNPRVQRLKEKTLPWRFSIIHCPGKWTKGPDALSRYPTTIATALRDSNSFPWITPNIKNLMKARDFHKKKAVKFNSQVHWAKYKDTRNKVNSELYKAKKRYFCDKFEDCAQTKDPKQSWHHNNHLLGRKFKSNNIPQLKIGDTIISDNLMIAEAFNDFFVSIGPKLSAEIVHDAQDLSENPSTSPVTLFTLSEISEYEVFLLLSNLKTSKSTGMDSIPARVLKISAEIISPSLTWIFNLCIKTGVYIDDWKKAWVVPIFKSEDRKKCENYRPISISPIISKIFERSVFNQLYEFLNANNLLSKHQFGFRPKYSTLAALIQMCDAWYENMDNGELNGVVFIDIRKAFDSINHNILLRKMKEQFGISNIELKLFESYLSDREQVSFVNGAMSAPKRIVCGVPQGSILGPLLFLLYINDLPDCLEKSTPCLYADDSQIFSSAKDCVELNANLNHDLNNVSQWLVNNKLPHHSTKTKLMYVGSNHNLAKIDNEFPVMINDQLIPRVHSISCLGVKLDETLNWDEHIEMVCKKVGAGIGILKRIKPYVPANTLISIYNALIQPYFDYCSPLWGVCNKTLRDNLQKFQNRAARIIAGASYEIRSADVLRTLDWENLETRWHLTKAKFLYKVLSNSAAPTLKDSFISRNTLLNNYNLRNSQTDLTLPKPNREFLKRSFKYSGAYLWNNLPLEAKQAQSIYLFKSCIKQNL